MSRLVDVSVHDFTGASPVVTTDHGPGSNDSSKPPIYGGGCAPMNLERPQDAPSKENPHA